MKNVGVYFASVLMFVITCGSEWCQDDCHQKFVFTILNMNSNEVAIDFNAHPFSCTDTVLFHPPKLYQTITIQPNKAYTDSFEYHIRTNGWCDCSVSMFEYSTQMIVSYSDGQFQKTYNLYPGCEPCKTKYSPTDTFPGYKKSVYYDTVEIT